MQSRILVVGAGNIERSQSGSWITKAPIASYLHELADRFGHCTWIAQRPGTWGIARRALEGRIDPAKVTVVEMESRVLHTPRNCWLLITHALCRPYAIVFLPAALTMVPALPLVRLLCRRLVVYLADALEKALFDPDARRRLLDAAKPRRMRWGRLESAAHQHALILLDEA